HRRLVGTILQRFEQKGLRIVALKIVQASTELAEKHYAVHHGRHFYDSLITFLTSGPTVALVLEGREAIAVVRHLMGPTDGAKALLAAHGYGGDTVQLFTASPQTWPVPLPLPEDVVRLFRRTLRQTRLRLPLVHDSYLINLASPVETLYRRSIEAFVDELNRAERIGARYLVTHPGAFISTDEETGLQRVASALDEAHRRCPNYRVRVLLETTA